VLGGGNYDRNSHSDPRNDQRLGIEAGANPGRDPGRRLGLQQCARRRGKPRDRRNLQARPLLSARERGDRLHRIVRIWVIKMPTTPGRSIAHITGPLPVAAPWSAGGNPGGPLNPIDWIDAGSPATIDGAVQTPLMRGTGGALAWWHKRQV